MITSIPDAGGLTFDALTERTLAVADCRSREVGASVSRRPTVVEVADRAGVSIASVSRVLNGKPARPDTEDRVRAAVAELGYVPDATGPGPQAGRTLQVGLRRRRRRQPGLHRDDARGRGGHGRFGGTAARLVDGPRPADLVAVVAACRAGYADGLIISPLRRSPELVDALVGAPGARRRGR